VKELYNLYYKNYNIILEREKKKIYIFFLNKNKRLKENNLMILFFIHLNIQKYELKVRIKPILKEIEK